MMVLVPTLLQLLDMPLEKLNLLFLLLHGILFVAAGNLLRSDDLLHITRSEARLEPIIAGVVVVVVLGLDEALVVLIEAGWLTSIWWAASEAVNKARRVIRPVSRVSLVDRKMLRALVVSNVSVLVTVVVVARIAGAMVADEAMLGNEASAAIMATRTAKISSANWIHVVILGGSLGMELKLMKVGSKESDAAGGGDAGSRRAATTRFCLGEGSRACEYAKSHCFNEHSALESGEWQGRRGQLAGIDEQLARTLVAMNSTKRLDISGDAL